MGRIYKTAIINETNAGDKEIVAAVVGEQITLHALVLTATADGTFRFESAAGGTALTGVMNFTTNDTIVWPFNEVGWCNTDLAGDESLSMELAGTVDVDGVIIYSENSD